MPVVNPRLSQFANAFDQDPDLPAPAEPLPHQRRVPLLVYLHGIGEFGGNAPEEQVKQHGPWEDVRSIQPDRYHADAIAGQHGFRILGLHGTPARGDWEPDQVSNAIDEYRIRYRQEIDEKRICLTGVSRGGRGVLRTVIYRLQNHLPVQRAVVFCPERKQYTAQEIDLLGGIPLFFFHCNGDIHPYHAYNDTRDLQRSIGQLSALRTISAAELRWPNAPHTCWTFVYGHPGMYRWLLLDPLPNPNAWDPMIRPLPYP